MSIAESCIADLDAALAATGQTVKLRRLTAGPNGVQIPFSVDCAASLSDLDPTPSELIAGITQARHLVVLSPTEITRAGWPGPTTKPTTLDPRIPTVNDKVIIGGRTYNIESSIGKSPTGVLVRIELKVKG